MGSPLNTNIVTYKVGDLTCENVLPKLYEGDFLSWAKFTCTDLKDVIRRGFDEWQHNSMVTFREVESDEANIDITVETLSGALARVVQHQKGSRIEIADNVCWYTDRHLCFQVKDNLYIVCMCVVLIWIFSTFICVYVCCKGGLRDGTRVLNLGVFISAPFVLAFVVLPCTECHDLRYTLVHEVGHTLGFMHSDQLGVVQQCGCGHEAVGCILHEHTENSIMYSTIKHSNSVCLSSNDVDGLRSHYGGNCTDPVLCYERTSFTGSSRVAICILYGFASATILVALQHVAMRSQCKIRRTNDPRLRV